jgi:hypothetical protein
MILQYDLNGNLLGKFKSIKTAVEQVIGITPSGVSQCVNGRYKQHKGYVWVKKKEAKPQKEKNTRDDPNRSLIEGEIDVFRSERHHVKDNFYEIICFNEIQAKTLAVEIPRRFEKFNWKAEYVYDQYDGFYIVDCWKEGAEVC